jgi:hypothetical protein
MDSVFFRSPLEKELKRELVAAVVDLAGSPVLQWLISAAGSGVMPDEMVMEWLRDDFRGGVD